MVEEFFMKVKPYNKLQRDKAIVISRNAGSIYISSIDHLIGSTKYALRRTRELHLLV